MRSSQETMPSLGLGALAVLDVDDVLQRGQVAADVARRARQRSGLVRSTTAPESARRSFTASGPKAENSGPMTAPAFSVPKTAA